MPENDQEKTEQPTSRRRDEARQEGNFATSKELSSFFVIFGSLLILYFSALWIFTGVADFMKSSFSGFKGEISARDLNDLLRHVSYKFFLAISPVFAIPAFGAVSYLIQNGFVLTGKKLAPDFSKISPLAGVRRLFSLNSVAELVKSVLKVSVLGYVVYMNVAKEWSNLPFLIDMEVAGSLTYMSKITFRIMVKTAWVVAAIAGIDYLFQRWQFEKSLRMTKEEIKEEMKEMEGDPIVKARIRSIQREIARKRMMQDVPKADVVLTNPTHIAVALKYDREKAPAPIVVAKGAGFIAERIKEIAGKHRVPVIENKPLARNIFRHVEIGREIPVSLYKAVAEILAYVYRLKSKVRT